LLLLDMLSVVLFLMASARHAVAFNNDSGPVLWYRFATGSGSSLVDSSANGQTAMIYGPQWISGPTTGCSHALAFDGNNDYVEVSAAIPADLKIQGGFAIEAWIFALAHPSGCCGTIISSRDGSIRQGYVMALDGRADTDGEATPVGHIHFGVGFGASWFLINSLTAVPLGQWVHVAAMREPFTNGTIYYDGIPQPVITKPWGTWNGSITYNPSPVFLGRERNLNRFYAGAIAEVRVYNRTLEPAEVALHAQQVPSPTCTVSTGMSESTAPTGSTGSTGFATSTSSTSTMTTGVTTSNSCDNLSARCKEACAPRPVDSCGCENGQMAYACAPMVCSASHDAVSISLFLVFLVFSV
jgi:Concanavalin A-like lectin/glucanases superfamily